MNPDPQAMEDYAAGYDRAKREITAKRNKSRAAQPRRRDNLRARNSARR